MELKYLTLLVIGISLLLLGTIVVYQIESTHKNEKIDCNKFDSNGVRIVCGGESYMIEGQTYGSGNNKFVYRENN